MSLTKEAKINWCENTRKMLKEAMEGGNWMKVWEAMKMLEKLEKELKED